MEVVHEVKLDRTEMIMIRWIFGFTVKERNTELRNCWDWNQSTNQVGFNVLNVNVTLSGSNAVPWR